MTDSKHTPGPWEAQTWTDPDGPDDDKGGLFFISHGEHHGGVPWTKANLACINAAPDLLAERDRLRAALEACLAYERKAAEYRDLSDCTCINHNQNAADAYEDGRCPHQIARDLLTPQRGGQSDG